MHSQSQELEWMTLQEVFGRKGKGKAIPVTGHGGP
jgi:hypothetical protein